MTESDIGTTPGRELFPEKAADTWEPSGTRSTATENRENAPWPNSPGTATSLRTTDPEAMAQWFEKTLGAEVLRTMQQGEPRIDLKIGGADVFIAPVAPAAASPPRPRPTVASIISNSR